MAMGEVPAVLFGCRKNGDSARHGELFATGFQKRQGNEGHDIPVLVSGGLVMVGPQLSMVRGRRLIHKTSTSNIYKVRL